MREMTSFEIAQASGGILIAGDASAVVDNVRAGSRECIKNSLFVPLVGEHTDAHDYIGDAYARGASAVFTSRGEVLEGTGSMAYIKVPDTRAALQRLGTYYRKEIGIPVIGVTGSVGKTTTKEMMYRALSSGIKVIKTKGNWNSQVGLPRMMLELSRDYDAAVIEMGMSLEGEMARLAEIAAPQTAVITNIGMSHIGNLGSREAIMREKLSIINGFEDGGYLLLNGDDPLLRTAALRGDVMMTDKTRRCFERAVIETYGLSAECDYRALNVSDDGVRTEFDFVYKGGGEHVVLNVIGMHNVYNALASLAIALRFGVGLREASGGLPGYRPEGMRGELSERDGITVINDAYNASPDSMKSGMELLIKTRAKRHIAVLADVLELGEMSRQCHLEIGRMAASLAPDAIITVGEQSAYIGEGARASNPGVTAIHYESNGDALAWLKGNLRHGDAVLFKGSRGMHLEEIIEGLF